MRVIYMYHELEPQRGSVIAGNLPDPVASFRGFRSLFLTQTPKIRSAAAAAAATTDDERTTNAGEEDEENDEEVNVTQLPDDIETLELRNVDVELPLGGDTLYWCKMFKLNDIARKSHVIKVCAHRRQNAKQHKVNHWGGCSSSIAVCNGKGGSGRGLLTRAHGGVMKMS